MLKMVDGTGIIGVDMVCPLGGTVSPPQPPNYDKVEMEGVGSLTLLNSLKAPLERLDLIGNSVQLTTTGKNLLNIPFIDGNVSETPIQCNFEKRILIHAETLPKSIQSNVWRIKIVYKDNTLKYVVDSDMQKGSLFDASPENPIVSINYRGLYITEGQYEKIQVEHGVKVTPYEPYTGGKPSPSTEYPQEIKNVGKWNEGTQKYEIDVKITNAEQNWSKEQTLTLTSDRPITKWDRLVEQGGQYGWLYKHRIVNDLSALVKDSEPIYGKDGEKYFSVSLQGALFNYDYNKIYSVAGLCPKDSKIHYVPKPMIQSVVIYVSDTDTIMTAKEHMHYKVIYETTESQFAPLSESEQTQLRNLHSYNGTTHVFVDSGEVPCGIKLTYRKEI